MGSYIALPFSLSMTPLSGTAVLIVEDTKRSLLTEIDVASAEDIDSRRTTKTRVGGTVGLAFSC
jgi:hypothetical protein